MKLNMKRPTDTPSESTGSSTGTGSSDVVETIDTLIGAGTTLKGDLEFTGGLRVDGLVNGHITTKDDSKGTLVLSETGLIEGDINVPNLVINGVVNGNIHSTGHVELQSNAQVTGDIRYAALEIGLGAALNGSLVSNTNAKKAEPAYDLISGGIEQDNT